jgi:hypothetical protein
LKNYGKTAKYDKNADAIVENYSHFKDKPIWVTETCIDKKKMDPYYTTEEFNRFVAKDIPKRYSTLFKRGIKKVFWFEFADNEDTVWTVPMEPNDFEGFRGLADSTLIPKPAYYTYKLLIQKANGKSPVKRQRFPGLDPDVRIYTFGKDDNLMYVVWYDSSMGDSTEAFLPLPWEEVLITRVITEPGITEPDTEIRSTENGELQLILDDSPIFIEAY